jgi:hypothetical protein
MEVTIENFEQVMPLLEASIHLADFIAIDTEFSGKNRLNAHLCGNSMHSAKVS